MQTCANYLPPTSPRQLLAQRFSICAKGGVFVIDMISSFYTKKVMPERGCDQRRDKAGQGGPQFPVPAASDPSARQHDQVLNEDLERRGYLISCSSVSPLPRGPAQQ